jgi:hypothetical protein
MKSGTCTFFWLEQQHLLKNKCDGKKSRFSVIKTTPSLKFGMFGGKDDLMMSFQGSR